MITSSTMRLVATTAGALAALATATGVMAADSPPAAAMTPNAAPAVTAERLLNTDNEPQNWLTYHRDYSGHRFSPLKDITPANVANLKVAFTFPLGGLTGGGAFKHAALEGTPLVNEGFLYATNGWGEVFKLNVRDGFGKLIWKMDPQTDKEWSAGVTCCDIDNRGVGLWKDKVVSHTLDGRIILTDDATGETVWDEKRADPDKGEVITAAPLVVKDLAITGMAGAEKGVRGWLSATDLTTGKEAWRTYMVPGPGEPGFDSWGDDHNAWKYGGASTWGNGTYDPKTNMLYWGTANPGPDFDPEYRPGDNLYAASMVVLDADTGKMSWFFQYTPNEPYDHDEIGEHPLIDVKMNGQDRHLVVHAARNGYYYAFDRDAEEFVVGTQFVDKLTWTKGLDPKTGKPIDYNPKSKVQTYNSDTFGLRGQTPKADVCPTTMGGKNWQPTAYNPDLHVLYIPTIESCGVISAKEQDKPVAEGGQWALPKSFTGAGNTTPSHVSGSLVAMDVTTGKIVGKLPQDYAMWGGALTTGGGLVFSSTADGWVKAFDAKTLKELWKFNVGNGINAPPMSYAYNGKQYIAIEVGELQSAPWRGIQEAQSGMEPMSTLYVFAL